MQTPLSAGSEVHADALARELFGRGGKRLLVIMGLPASGKSTLCDRLDDLGAIRVNRDNIRKRLYGDESIIGDQKEVNREYYKELKEAFTKGIPVVSDNVNITVFHRKGTIAAAREAGYTDITIVWVDVPLEVALERNRNRQRQVRESVIKSMDTDLRKEGGPAPDEGRLVKLNNGADKDHYQIITLRAAGGQSGSATSVPAPGGAEKGTSPMSENNIADRRGKLVGDLRVHVNLLEALIAADRSPWAGQVVLDIQRIAGEGAALFAGADAPTGTTGATSPAAPAKKPWIPPTPEQVLETLMRMIGSRPVVDGTGPLVVLCFNGHLLDKDKAERLLLPLTELVKRAHVVIVQESNVDALRIIAKAARYGLNASHRNTRAQACGILFHPRLHWLGKAPYYHDYLTDVPNHPEMKATLRPALQRRVRDIATGDVYDFINMHTKSNLGGPDQTRPTRRWQFEALVANLAGQETKSPYAPREDVRPKPASDTADGAKSAFVDDSGWDAPLGAVIIGGDYNAPIEKPETTEIEPLIAAGFARVSTADLRWSYQYRGSGGQFDGFFVRGLGNRVRECFIPEFPTNRRDAAFYREVSDHLPVFMVIEPGTPAAEPAPAPAATAVAESAPAA